VPFLESLMAENEKNVIKAKLRWIESILLNFKVKVSAVCDAIIYWFLFLSMKTLLLEGQKEERYKAIEVRNGNFPSKDFNLSEKRRRQKFSLQWLLNIKKVFNWQIFAVMEVLTFQYSNEIIELGNLCSYQVFNLVCLKWSLTGLTDIMKWIISIRTRA
jgi:hypothetical protein